MMMKTWVWSLLAGFGWCAFLVGIIVGDIGNSHPAYTSDFGSVMVAAFVTFVPLILGMHTGVSYMRECEAKKVTTNV